MSEQGAGGAGATGTVEAARDKAGEVATGVAEEATGVAHTVTEQASTVARDAASHAKDLWESSLGELRTQADERTGQFAATLRELGDELNEMSGARPDGGMATDLVRDAGQRVSSLAQRLDTEGLDGLRTQVTGMARRHPGAFLAGAAVTGFLAGRAMRAAQEALQEEARYGVTPSATPARAASPPMPAGPDQVVGAAAVSDGAATGVVGDLDTGAGPLVAGPPISSPTAGAQGAS